MASEAGVRGMIAEAFHRKADIADALSAVDGHHAKVLWVLINHAPAFHAARQILAAASAASGNCPRLDSTVFHTSPWKFHKSRRFHATNLAACNATGYASNT
jgi:hypothetical protein